MNKPETFVISTHDLGKSYGNFQALDSINLNVQRNSIFGFLGPNGAGKTTLMKTLLGLVRPTSGSATIFGKDIVADSVEIRERIGYLPQQPRFIDYMTARENLLFIARFYFRGPEQELHQRCEEMLALVGLEDKADRSIKGFSGGEKQRLGIALAQVNDPDLLILDEPASALDPLGRHEVLSIMDRLRKHTTVFYSTHILDDVQRISDTVAILDRGKLVASGPIEQILNGKDEVVYTLAVKGYPPLLEERLAGLAWVKNIQATHKDGSTVWQISVSDDAAAEAGLLRHVLEDQRIMVIEFSRRKYELEEVFMEMVKGGNHGGHN